MPDNKLARLDAQETRTVTEGTGGEKGVKTARFELLPPRAMWKVAELFGAGANKYEDHNWRRGYEWSKSYGAAQRHLNQFWAGESIDPELGTHHLASAVFHMLVLMTFEEEHPELDDRYETQRAIEEAMK